MPYAIEEAYEIADAISCNDIDHLREEIAKLLLQVVYHAQMSEKADKFAFGDVVQGITTNMIRRLQRRQGARGVFGQWHVGKDQG